ncbi:reverse transcriptase-like protein [Staphylococcus aureus]|nr:reverse transcriptase-like protein [Staphylococcus aureus]HEH8166806.1 type II toxin-antitoxin system RnlA family toxin [Staphylococcus aureus]
MVTDGSFDKDLKRYGFGLVMITKNMEDIFYDSDNDKKYLQSMNVSGEVFGVLEGLRICKDNNYKNIIIYYDYEGLEKWAKGEWKAKKDIAKHYVEELKKYNELSIKFIKVKAHSGHKYNEQADALAKLSLDKKGSKTYDDGTIYIKGVKKQTITNVLYEIKQKYLDKFNLDEKKEDYKTFYTLSSNTNKVIISYYEKSLSLYIQGKSSELFSDLIGSLVEKSGDLKQVNNILNNVYKRQIEVDTIEETMKEIIPNYEANNNNIDKIVYSAIFNYKVDCIKYDYSDLIYPTFRIQEHMLHRILNDKMGLDTDQNGRNNFSFFQYDNNNSKYFCNSNNHLTLISHEEQDLLNDIYNYYRNYRHALSHTSYVDMDIEIVENIETARKIILEGQKLFNRFCELNK